jgi:hypothetical protein
MPLSIGRHGNSDFWRNDLFFPHLNPSSGNKTFGAIRDSSILLFVLDKISGPEQARIVNRVRSGVKEVSVSLHAA